MIERPPRTMPHRFSVVPALQQEVRTLQQQLKAAQDENNQLRQELIVYLAKHIAIAEIYFWDCTTPCERLKELKNAQDGQN